MSNSDRTNEAPKHNFWKGVKVEYKKITWPSKEDLIKQSTAVLSVTVALGIVISILDALFQYGVNWLTTI